MAGSTTSRQVWALVESQHGVVSRRQLLDLGYSSKAIEHRLAKRLLRPLWRGVYAVGRGRLTRYGWWMAAVLACGPGALLSHASAAALWGIRAQRAGDIDVSVPRRRDPRHPGIRVHRRRALAQPAIRHGIPVTDPARTLIDIAPSLSERELEAAINEADKLDLISPAALRAEIDGVSRPGAGTVRRLLDEATFVLTDSELERLFLPIARRAGLPTPRTQVWLHGHRVDFHWPDRDLAVETDGARFHRTPFQQTDDRRREHALAAAEVRLLRFTHAQVRYEPRYVERILARYA